MSRSLYKLNVVSRSLFEKSLKNKEKNIHLFHSSKLFKDKHKSVNLLL